MPTPEDRAFFESLNKDLAKNIGDSLKEALKESDKGKGKGDGKDDGTAAAKISVVLRSLNKTIGSMMSLVGDNVSNVAAFGDTIARTAVATKQTGLFQAEKLTDEFGKFGFNLRQVGVMLNSAMMHNVRGVTKSTQRFIARTQGFDTNMGSVAKFLQTQTNVLGNDIESTETLGHVMQDVARESGIVATAMFEAVNAFTENTRTLKAVYGGDVGAQFQTALGSLVATVGIGFENDVKSLISALSPTDFEGMRKITILGESIGAGDLSPQAMRADPKAFLARAITALDRVAREADAVKPGDEFSRLKFIEQRVGAFVGDAANLLGISNRLMNETRERGGSIGTLMTPEGMTAAERAVDTAKAQEEVVTHSEAAAKAMYDFAVETAATILHYKKLQVQTEITKDMFYGLGDEAHNATRQLFGFSTALAGMASQALGILTPLSNLLLTFALFRRPGALLRGGKGGGGGWGAGFRTVPPIPPSKTRFPGAVHQKLGQPRGGRWVQSKTSMATAQGRASLGLGRGGGLKSLGRAARVPGIGGIIAGGMEYAENKDVSRAVTAGAAAGVGGWAGFGLGMAAGTLFGPAAVVMSPLLGILGALTGGGWLSKQAVDIHDKAGYFEGSEINAEKASMVMAEQAGTDRIVASADRTTDAVNTLAAALNEGVVTELAGTQEQRVAAMEQQFSLEATVAAARAHGPGGLLTQVLGGGGSAPSLGAFAGLANSGGNSGVAL